MKLFYAGAINDDRAGLTEYACGVEVLACAPSRMDATVLLRQRGFTLVRSRDLKTLEPAVTDDGEVPMPTVGEGEVWVRTVHTPGAWEKR